jgi:hypothetical protein
MDSCKKHANTAIILTAIVSSVVWMNEKFNQVFWQVILRTADNEYTIYETDNNEDAREYINQIIKKSQSKIDLK